MKTICHSALKIFIISALITMFTGVLAHGQDIIVQKNGEEIKAKVEQVLDTEIRYRKFDNQSGPQYVIKKAEVFMIKYENGSKDIFTTQPAPVVPQTQPAPASKANITDSDIRPAKTGAIINYALIAPILAVGTIAAVSEGDAAIGFGAGATLVAGIGIPIGALIAGKTRRNTGADGSLGLRITGWISYGLTLADAIAMLALSEDVDFEGGPVIAATALGTLSTVFFALDASQTVREAKSLQNRVSLLPTIGYVRDMAGNKYNTIGLRINF